MCVCVCVCVCVCNFTYVLNIVSIKQIFSGNTPWATAKHKCCSWKERNIMP